MDLLFIFLIVENIIERFIPFFSYTDEAISLLFLMLLVIKLPRARFHKYYLQILGWFMGVLIIGLFSTLVFAVQSNTTVILKDVLAISKFFIVYLYASIFLSKKRSQRIVRNITLFSKIYIPILLIFGIINQFVNIGMDSGYRGGIKTFTFLYSHSTFLVAAVVVLCAVLIAQGIKKNIYTLGCAFIVLTLSMRSKAFIYMASVVILILLIQHRRDTSTNLAITTKIRKRIYFSGLIIAVSALVIARNKIIDYFAWGLAAARPALYIVGMKILHDFFPLGSGFASFASSLSGEYYSPLYFQYGIDGVSGLQQSEGYEYMSDTFWPYIIAQFGLFGTIMYLLSLFYIFKNILRVYRANSKGLIAALSLFIYVIAGCFVESMLTNAAIILVALALGYYLILENNSTEMSKTN